MEFMKAMIPHHAAAILMVKETQLKDPEVQKLAHDIITSQQEQIVFMKAKLVDLEKNSPNEKNISDYNIIFHLCLCICTA